MWPIKVINALRRSLRNMNRDALLEHRGVRRFRLHAPILVHELHERKSGRVTFVSLPRDAVARGSKKSAKSPALLEAIRPGKTPHSAPH
ncbi:hypothetical protein CBM2625_U20010 [Cupriavidus taiwanensis]|nr:hypothetical protein CBM2625_U20010 [Cupriavidus taiwanensis]